MGLEGIEAIVFRTVGDQPSLWESILPEEVRRLPEELGRVDALLDNAAFFAPFVLGELMRVAIARTVGIGEDAEVAAADLACRILPLMDALGGSPWLWR